MTDPTPPAPSWPSRIWALPLEYEESDGSVWFAAPNVWNTGWRKTKPREYIAVTERTALLESAVAEAKRAAREEGLDAGLSAASVVLEDLIANMTPAAREKAIQWIAERRAALLIPKQAAAPREGERDE